MNQTLQKTENRPAQQQAFSQTQFLTPLANIMESQDGYILEAEMPGVNKEGLEITVENGELHIIGRRGEGPKFGQLLYQESRQLPFRRVFELDPSIDVAKISAKMDQGVLRLTLPRSESVKPRKIAVTE